MSEQETLLYPEVMMMMMITGSILWPDKPSNLLVLLEGKHEKQR
jgi:hypothetical protein